MTPPRRWRAIVVGLLGVGVLASALVVMTRDDAPATPVASGSSSTQSQSTATASAPLAKAEGALSTTTTGSATAAGSGTGPTIEDVLAANSDPSPGANDVLIAGLSSTDPVVVAESANGLVGRGALSALPTLVDLDVINHPKSAPSIIYAMGRLASLASDEERTEAIERLLALLTEEKRRGAQESQGNLLQIYEALGHTGDARAIAPLERELADASVPTAPKVVVVQALVALNARQSRPALERLRDALEPTANGPDFEAALRRDLLAAIRDALVQLS